MRKTARSFLSLLLTVSMLGPIFGPVAQATLPFAPGVELWMDATRNVFSDSGATTASPNANVQEWKDLSGNDNVLEQTVGASQPKLRTNVLNFNPALDFGHSGANDFLADLSPDLDRLTDGSALDGARAKTVFIVAQRDTTGDRNSAFYLGPEDPNDAGTSLAFATDLSSRFEGVYDDETTNGIEGRYTIFDSAQDSSRATLYSFSNADVQENQHHIYEINANQIVSAATNPTLSPNLEIDGVYVGTRRSPENNGLNTNYFEGNIAEVIVYDVELSMDTRRKVQSYLALKYGITLDADAADVTKNQTYTATDSTVIWDDVKNADFNNNIAGLFRNDAVAANQRVSTSQDVHSIITMATSNDFVSPNDANRPTVENNKYLIWGNNNQSANAWTDENAPADFVRLGNDADDARAWKVQETWDLGNTFLQVDTEGSSIANIPDLPAGAELQLLVGQNGDFTNATNYPMTNTSGSLWSAEVDLENMDCFTFGYIIPETVTVNVEMITPDGDNGLGPFDVNISCANGDSHDFTLSGGDTATFDYPAGTAMDCTVTQTLTGVQDGFFTTVLGDDLGADDGNMDPANSDDADGKTFTVTNTFMPTGTVDINVNLTTPDGDQGIGPFEVTVTCADPAYNQTFSLNDGDTVTFQYPADTEINCSVGQNFTPGQAAVFTEVFGDDLGPDNGVMNTTTGPLDSNDADGKTFTVVNTLTNPPVVTINVTLETPNGDNNMGPFEVIVTCADPAYNQTFSLNDGDVVNFDYPADTDIDCSVGQNLTPAQATVFAEAFGDDFSTNNGRMNTTGSGTLDSDDVDGSTFIVTNTFMPAGVIDLNVTLSTPDGDQALGPFEATIVCTDTDYNQTFSMNDGDTVTFQYPADSDIDCSVGQNLTPAQLAVFTEAFGDDFSTNNGRINVGNSTPADGTTFTIVNTLTNQNTVTMNVALFTPNGDNGLGPFDVNVACANGDSHDFTLNGGDTASFNYPAGVPVNCTVSQTLNGAQTPVFTTVLGDDFGPDNGTMNSVNSDNVDGKTFTVTNTYVPAGTVDINVTLSTPDGDQALGPFEATITCDDPAYNQTFSLNDGDTVTFQYPADTEIHCDVGQNLTPAQAAVFIETFGDDFGPDNGEMNSVNSNNVDGKTFTIVNTVDPSPGEVEINVRVDLPDGGDAFGPFAVTVTCDNGDIHNFSLNGGETASFTYPENEPIDCRVTQDLTPIQITKFTELLGDDYGPNNGAMITNNTISTDGKTFIVTNTLIDHEQCEAEIGAKIWNGMSNTNVNQSVLLEEQGETITFDISTTDGQFVNRVVAGQIAYDERESGTYTVMPDRPLFDLELFFASIANSSVGNFTLTYENGTTVTNAPFTVIQEVVTKNGAMGDFTSDTNDDTLAQIVTIGGAEYLQDPLANGVGSQAAARITFPGTPIGPTINGITKIEFEVITSGQQLSSLGIMGLKTGFEILDEEDCDEPEPPVVTPPTSSGSAPSRYVVQVCDELTGKVSNRFPYRDSTLSVDQAYQDYYNCVQHRASKSGHQCAEEWALAKGFLLGDGCNQAAPKSAPVEPTPVEEIQNEFTEEASFDRTEPPAPVQDPGPKDRWNRYENNLRQMTVYPLTGAVPDWLRNQYQANSVLPYDSANARYYEPTVNLLRQGIVDGFEDSGDMNINLPLRRSEMAKVAAIGKEAYKNYAGNSSMSDVSTDAWYYPYAESMVREGVMTTDSFGNFRPDEAVPLGHFMTAISRAFNLEATKANFIARNLLAPELHNMALNEPLMRGEAFDILARVLNMKDRGTYASQDQVSLSIPQKGINDLPATNTVITDASVWLDDITNTGAAHYYDPHNDNYVVFAHSSIWEGDPTPFGPVMKNLIGGMDDGEIVELTANGETAQYRVVSSGLVSPYDVGTANDSAADVDLIIFTCGEDYPNERWVIKAEKL